ncbi:hypothetical protein ZHAS_00007378 [Anopheles sinensis]|uniref:Uncharacterized protein n=1 Tax=Anopheles sinensis TaxID=74873 RepID=A0A084VPU6_ANOSI|nr:hypothetical protein ZHAS_00007378 [Anopheles sinensis]
MLHLPWTYHGTTNHQRRVMFLPFHLICITFLLRCYRRRNVRETTIRGVLAGRHRWKISPSRNEQKEKRHRAYLCRISRRFLLPHPPEHIPESSVCFIIVVHGAAYVLTTFTHMVDDEDASVLFYTFHSSNDSSIEA